LKGKRCFFMGKYFVNKEQICGDSITITGDDVAHISRVLRMNVGDEIVICDGFGMDYFVEITSVTKADITAKILSSRLCEAEPKTEIILFQALPKQGKMEYIIQKNTELGISKIVPVYTKRCVVKPSDKRERYQKIAYEAAKQCGRGIIPIVTATVSFDEAIAQISEIEKAIMLYECEDKTTLKQIIDGAKFNQIAVFVGPEGGFDKAEVEKAEKAHIATVTLGKRILRTETAAAAVVPIIMYQQDEI